MPGPAENPVARSTPAGSKGMEPENEPRSCHHQLAVHAQEGTPEVRLQQKQHHTVRDLVSATQFGKQSEYLQIEPDQRDHDSECAVPLHIFGSADLHALLDEVEIEHKVQRRDGDHNQAKADSNEPGAVD